MLLKSDHILKIAEMVVEAILHTCISIKNLLAGDHRHYKKVSYKVCHFKEVCMSQV